MNYPENTFEKSDGRDGERGNVLFLILIAVALFAALSYAVTQSTRSGSNDSNREQSLIGSAQVTQYPAGVRTSLVRMIIGGISAEDLYFNPPSSFDSVGGTNTAALIEDNDGDTTDETRAVFHPLGGGSPYQLAQPEVMATGSQGQWVFADGWEVLQIGRTVASSGDGNDLVAFLPGISAGLCRRINEEYGIGVGSADADSDGIPAGPTLLPNINTHNMTEANAPGFNTAELATIGGQFTGQPYGCYDTSDGDSGAAPGPYVYYHVLVER